MGTIYPSRAEDLEILDVLDLRFNEGLSATETAKATGKTRSAILGTCKRVRDADQPCLCRKPENQDGGMSRRWWE